MAFLVGRRGTGLNTWLRNRGCKKARQGMGVPAGRQLDGAAGREAGTDERVESGLTTFPTAPVSCPLPVSRTVPPLPRTPGPSLTVRPSPVTPTLGVRLRSTLLQTARPLQVWTWYIWLR
jgi:hypothetical protein